MDTRFDRNPPSCNRDQGYVEMDELIKQPNLEDIFRKRFQTNQFLTFLRGTSISRIDLI